MDYDKLKPKFLKNLETAGGIVYVALKSTGVSRSVYDRWRKSDPDFAESVQNVQEDQVDFVESALMKKVREGDTSSIIFYLKTKGKKRGWTEKALPNVANVPQGNLPALPDRVEEIDEEKVKERVKVMEKKVRNKKGYIMKLLKNQGKYTAELSMQVTIAAQLLVKIDNLSEEILADGYKSIDVEISREGNERKSINPKEKLYLDYVQQSQRALRALGMNTDAKERRTDNDAFVDFLEEFKND